MAQSHQDNQHEQGAAHDELEREAKKALAQGTSKITVGGDALGVWDVGGVAIERRADDTFCDRISIGGNGLLNGGAYLNYRGDPERVWKLLHRATEALRMAIDGD